MNGFIQKYQPVSINDFNYETDFINFVNTLIESDNLNLILVGKPDIGKTSFLNIIIKKYFNNVNDYEKNIMFINNSKEQGINYYRNEVKNFCKNSSCILNKKKIILIDDIDLLNEHSQQVFRSCIDKYSKNVHFLCSCTNIHKIIESLQSRLLLLKIPNGDIVNNLYLKIKNNENINIDKEVEPLFFKICQNSIRICVNYLEKFKLYNETINKKNILNLCTNINNDYFDLFIEKIFTKDISGSIDILIDLYDNGYSVLDILDSFYSYIKLNTTLSDEFKYKIIPVICKYIYIFYDIHEDEIELSLFTNNLINIIN